MNGDMLTGWWSRRLYLERVEMEIIPAILTSEVQELDLLLRQIRDSKKFERAQIDFVDGEYAGNETIKPVECDLIGYLPLKFDAHLMVVQKNIGKYIKSLFGFDRIIVQMESVSSPENYDCLALDIHSPIEAIEPYLAKLKLINLMAIEPGFGGQGLDPKILEKISYLRNLRSLKHLSFLICVDGGVEKEHFEILEKMGVDEVAVGAKRVLEW